MNRKQYNRIRRRKRLIRKLFVLSNIILMGVLIIVLVYWGSGKKEKNGISDKKINQNTSNQENSISPEDLETTIYTNANTSDFGKNYASKSDKCQNYVVCLDAGHGGTDIGAEGTTGKYEKEDTLQLSLLIKEYLESAGVKVVMTRKSDKTVSLDERRNIAENCGANLLLSIHRNIYVGAEDINGVEAWISNTRPEDATNISKKILQCIEGEVSGVKNRGVKWGTMDNVNENYGVNKVSMASLILEVGFMSSDYDNRSFEQYLDDYAKGIAKGVLDCI